MKAQWNVPNKASDTPRMVAERYQHQQLMMFYDRWQEDGGIADVTPGNTKRRWIKLRRLSQEQDSNNELIKHLKPDIGQESDELSDRDNDDEEVFLESLMLEESEMLQSDIGKISQRTIEIKKGYIVKQETNRLMMTCPDEISTYPRRDQGMRVILS